MRQRRLAEFTTWLIKNSDEVVGLKLTSVLRAALSKAGAATAMAYMNCLVHQGLRAPHIISKVPNDNLAGLLRDLVKRCVYTISLDESRSTVELLGTILMLCQQESRVAVLFKACAAQLPTYAHDYCVMIFGLPQCMMANSEFWTRTFTACLNEIYEARGAC